MNDQSQQKNELPESLYRQLTGFEKRLCVTETITACAGALLGLLLSYLILFISDRFFDTPIVIRFILLVTGTVTLSAFGLWWVRHWFWKRRDGRALARLIQHTYPKLGDRLLGAVELANGIHLPDSFSPALCRAAIAQVAKEAGQYEFKKAVSLNLSVILMISITSVILIAGIPAMLWPEAAKNALSRWIKPLSNKSRFTFVSINDLKSPMYVAHGEEFVIAIRVDEASFFKPVTASYQFENQAKHYENVKDKGVVFTVPGQTREGNLRIRIGDVIRNIRVIPILRPELRSLTATLKLPDYLEYSNQVQAIEHGNIRIVEGTLVSLNGVVSRDLKTAFLCNGSTTYMSVAKLNFTSPFMPVDKITNCVLKWTDSYDMTPAQPYYMDMNVFPDEKPVPDIVNAAPAVAILADETLTMDFLATDDFGLKQMGIFIEWEYGPKDNRKTGNFEKTLAEGRHDKLDLRNEFIFSPMVLHIPEDSSVNIYSTALDYYPGRVPALSKPFRVFIINRKDHAQLLKESWERLMGNMEDLKHREENLLAENEQLDKQDAEKMNSQETTEDLKKSQQNEQMQNQNMKELAEKAADLIKEALRNKDITRDEIEKMAKMAGMMDQVSSEQMPSVQKSLSDASDSKENRKENLEKAIEMQKKILDKLKEIAKETNKSMENMMINSFVNRLKELAKQQDMIGRSFRDNLQDLIGANSTELPEKLQNIITNSAKAQQNIRKEARYIQEDLGGFYTRTQKSVYKEVKDDMEKRNMQSELKSLSEQIEQNISSDVIKNSEQWNKQFTAWAEALDKTKNQGGGGGGGGGQEMTPEEMEIFLGLMKALQIEDNIRNQTRALEETKDTNKEYRKDSEKLSQKQEDSAKEVDSFKNKTSKQDIQKFLDMLNKEMMNVSDLLKRPQTDQETVTGETLIIELLAKALDQSQSGQQQSQGQEQGQGLGMMQAMMKSMQRGKGTGNKPGAGSTQGGTTQNDSGKVNGRPTSADGTDSSSQTFGGKDPAKWPKEFKDLLYDYFNALEEKP